MRKFLNKSFKEFIQRRAISKERKKRILKVLDKDKVLIIYDSNWGFVYEGEIPNYVYEEIKKFERSGEWKD